MKKKRYEILEAKRFKVFIFDIFINSLYDLYS